MRTIAVMDDAGDEAAIAAVLACARDRLPKVEFGCNGSVLSLQLTWTRTDGPALEASFRLSSFESNHHARIDPEGLRLLVVGVLESIDRTVDDATLRGWRDDLAALAMVAARDDDARGAPSIVDFCSASATTPWSSASAERSSPVRGAPTVPTVDADGVDAVLPDLPSVVLLRKADFNRKGGARVVAGALHGSGPFRNADPVAVLRAHARVPRFPARG